MAKRRSDPLAECVRLVEGFIRSKDCDEPKRLAKRIRALIPQAAAECREVGDDDDVTETFRDLERGLETAAGGRVERHAKIHRPHCLIACWAELRRRLALLRTWKNRTGDAVETYLVFATKALNTADFAAHQFPERDYIERTGPDGQMVRQLKAAYACPMEQALVAAEISPRETRDVQDTLLAHAVAAARERGESAYALPKLERVEKALHALAAHLRRGATRGVFATNVGQALARAINKAMILMPAKGVGKSIAKEIEQTKPVRHSKDFRSVKWYGADYRFTKTQAPIVQILIEAFMNGTPDVGGETLLEAVEASTSRLVDIFRGHPAWGTMIVDGDTKGSKRVQPPANPRES